MGLMDILGGAAKIAGKGYEGYGVDRQVKIKNALAQREEERSIQRDQVLNTLSAAQTDRALRPAAVPAVPRDPIADHLAKRKIDQAYPTRDTTPAPRSPANWTLVRPQEGETFAPYQVNPETGETRPLGRAPSPAGPAPTGMSGIRSAVPDSVSLHGPRTPKSGQRRMGAGGSSPSASTGGGAPRYGGSGGGLNAASSGGGKGEAPESEVDAALAKFDNDQAKATAYLRSQGWN